MKLKVLVLSEEAKKRRSESASQAVERLIDSVKKQYAAIDFGYDWKSEETQNAVRKLEGLDFSPIVEALLSLDDVNNRWSLGLKFTKNLKSMILNAQDRAGKLVNGSLGEWCPDAAGLLEKFWKDMLKKPITGLAAEHFETVRNGKLFKDLEDYGYGEYDFIAETLLSSGFSVVV